MSLDGRRCSARRIQFKKSYTRIYTEIHTVYVDKKSIYRRAVLRPVLVPRVRRGGEPARRGAARRQKATVCYGDLNYRLSERTAGAVCVCTGLIEYTGSN